MRIIKKIAQLFIQPVIRKRIHRTSIYTWKDITLHLPPGIFHPAYFFSTKFLLQHLMKKDVTGSSFLELGAGNGLISISAAKRGAHVSSSDISVKVIDLLKENARSNNVELRVLHSDLFDNIAEQLFSIIATGIHYLPPAGLSSALSSLVTMDASSAPPFRQTWNSSLTYLKGRSASAFTKTTFWLSWETLRLM